MTGLLSPSKFLNLEFLAALRKSRYISEDTTRGSFKEYNQEEVDSLYYAKAEAKAEKEINFFDKREGENMIKKGNETIVILKGEQVADWLRRYEKRITEIKEDLAKGNHWKPCADCPRV